MIRTFRTSATVTVAVVAFLGAGAGTADAAKGFKVHYEAGLSAYKAGKWKKALASFQKAWAVDKDAAALYSIARCHHNLGSLDEAVTEYERYLTKFADHKGATKAKGYLVDALNARGATELEALSHTAARATFSYARKLAKSVDPSGTSERASLACAGFGEALVYLDEPRDALDNLTLALAGSLPADRRSRVEKLARELAEELGEPTPLAPTALAPPASMPASATVGPESAPESTGTETPLMPTGEEAWDADPDKDWAKGLTEEEKKRRRKKTRNIILAISIPSGVVVATVAALLIAFDQRKPDILFLEVTGP